MDPRALRPRTHYTLIRVVGSRRVHDIIVVVKGFAVLVLLPMAVIGGCQVKACREDHPAMEIMDCLKPHAEAAKDHTPTLTPPRP